MSRAALKSFVPFRHIIIAGLLLPALAAAQPDSSPLLLDWDAPVQCPTGADVRNEVMRLLGTSASSGQSLSVRAAVTADGESRWTLTLKTSVNGESGERVLVGRSCRAVTDAAVLTLALTLNPELRLPEHDATQAGPHVQGQSRPTSPPRPAMPTSDTHGMRIAPPSNDTVHGQLRLFAGSRVFAAPDLAGEIGLGMGLSYERLHNWFEGSLTPEADAHSQVKRGAGAYYWRGSLTDLVCYSFGGEPFEIAPCLGLDGSRVQGHGYGFDQNHYASIAWVSAVFGADFGWKISNT